MKTPKKNYIILIVLVVSTVFVTLFISDVYLQKSKKESICYQYLNRIMLTELDEYIIENPNSIIYISDKYDLSNEHFEKEFKDNIEQLNLKNNVVFIDKSDLTSSVRKELKNKYNVDIPDVNNSIVLMFIDSKVTNIVIVDDNTNAYDFIDYGAFE